MEMNSEQELADIEKLYDEARRNSSLKYRAWRSARGRYHVELMARRSAGENMTIADMRAMEDCAIDNVDYVRDAYKDLNDANIRLDKCKRDKEEATRNYWDGKPSRH